MVLRNDMKRHYKSLYLKLLISKPEIQERDHTGANNNNWNKKKTKNTFINLKNRRKKEQNDKNLKNQIKISCF